MRGRVLAAMGTAVAVLLLSGCSGDGAPRTTPDPRAVVPGGPTVPDVPLETFPVDPPDTSPSVVRTADGDGLRVTTWGSSSCPRGPVGVTVTGRQEIRIELDFLSPGRGACSADLGPTTTGIEVLAGIAADEPLTVRLGDGDPVVVPPAG
jgi:hypothetical protein